MDSRVRWNDGGGRGVDQTPVCTRAGMDSRLRGNDESRTGSDEGRGGNDEGRR